MRHITDGVLRRLDDEPLAIPDRVIDHVAGCRRCSARRARIAHDTERARRLLSAPQLVPDADVAWARLQRELQRGGEGEAERRARRAPLVRPAARFPRVSLRAGLVIGAVGIVVAGTAAAATLTTIFAPTHVAPVSLSRSDLRAITAFTGLGDSPCSGASPPRAVRPRFGSEHSAWSSSGAAHPVSSLAEATARCRLSGVTARPRSRGGGRCPAGRRSAARERYRDLQLDRRGRRAGAR